MRYARDGVDWILNPGQSGGGCLIDLGTHGVDAILNFTGEPVEVVISELGYLAHNATVEDYALAMLRSEKWSCRHHRGGLLLRGYVMG